MSWVHEVHGGPCQWCKRQEPVDVYTQHIVWSALLFTSWNSETHVCCRRCGVRFLIIALLTCVLFGWWGFPFGVFLTPAQIVRNVLGLLRMPDQSVPSPELVDRVKFQLARDLATKPSQALAD